MTPARTLTSPTVAPSVSASGRGPSAGDGTTAVAGTPPPPLRERKKIRTRAAIRAAAHRLVCEQGYDATTVEQIAEAAEVSPSTVFRYFPAKEDIVLADECAPAWLGAPPGHVSPVPPGWRRRLEDGLRARPANEPLVESLRVVLRESWAAAGSAETPEPVRLRARLMLDVPAVRLRMVESMSDTGRMLCRVLADRTGRGADDLEVRVFAMGLVGALLETVLYWAEHGHRDPLPDLVDRALVTFEGGDGN